MNSIHKKLILMSLAYGMVMDVNQPTRQAYGSSSDDYDIAKRTIDAVMEALVSKGICFINHRLFQDLKDTLSFKLRGQVLFHSEIKSRRIFVTYTKAAR